MKPVNAQADPEMLKKQMETYYKSVREYVSKLETRQDVLQAQTKHLDILNAINERIWQDEITGASGEDRGGDQSEQYESIKDVGESDYRDSRDNHDDTPDSIKTLTDVDVIQAEEVTPFGISEDQIKEK